MSAFVPAISSFVPRSSRLHVSPHRQVPRISPRSHRATRIEAVVDLSTVSTVSLPASGVDSGKLSLSDAGTNATFIILYFYPRDCTPGCTTEAQDFRDFKADLDKLNATVIGVSPDDLASHDNFSSKESLNFSLISDDGTLADAFDAWKNHPVFGKVINRSTFILRDGKIIKEWRGVKATGHAAEVVESLKQLAA